MTNYGISTVYICLWIVVSLLLLYVVLIYVILEPKVAKIFYLERKIKRKKNIFNIIT